MKVKKLKEMIAKELNKDLSNSASTIALSLNGEPIDNDSSSLKEIPIWLENGQMIPQADYSVECEVFIEINVEVFGKGKDYAQKVLVKTSDSLDSLRVKVPFFKTFIQRKYQIHVKSTSECIKSTSVSFEQAKLENFATLILAEIGKYNQQN